MIVDCHWFASTDNLQHNPILSAHLEPQTDRLWNRLDCSSIHCVYNIAISDPSFSQVTVDPAHLEPVPLAVVASMPANAAQLTVTCDVGIVVHDFPPNRKADIGRGDALVVLTVGVTVSPSPSFL